MISGMLNSERPIVTPNVQKRMHNDANVHSLLLVQGTPVIIFIPSQVKIANSFYSQQYAQESPFKATKQIHCWKEHERDESQ